MKRLETRQVMVFYCDACGKECGGSFTSWWDASTNQDKHACDRLDNDGRRACVEQIERQRLEKALARRSSNAGAER